MVYVITIYVPGFLWPTVIPLLPLLFTSVGSFRVDITVKYCLALLTIPGLESYFVYLGHLNLNRTLVICNFFLEGFLLTAL